MLLAGTENDLYPAIPAIREVLVTSYCYLLGSKYYEEHPENLSVARIQPSVGRIIQNDLQGTR